MLNPLLLGPWIESPPIYGALVVGVRTLETLDVGHFAVEILAVEILTFDDLFLREVFL
jgi:hypothetical protein